MKIKNTVQGSIKELKGILGDEKFTIELSLVSSTFKKLVMSYLL